MKYAREIVEQAKAMYARIAYETNKDQRRAVARDCLSASKEFYAEVEADEALKDVFRTKLLGPNEFFWSEEIGAFVGGNGEMVFPNIEPGSNVSKEEVLASMNYDNPLFKKGEQ